MKLIRNLPVFTNICVNQLFRKPKIQFVEHIIKGLSFKITLKTFVNYQYFWNIQRHEFETFKD